MNKFILMMLSIGFMQITYAQKTMDKDTVPETVKKDTLRIGGLIIITKKDKKNKPKEVEIKDESEKENKGNKTDKDDDDNKSIIVGDKGIKRSKKKKSNVSTNWLALDLGFNNYKDETNYSSSAVTSVLKSTTSTTAPTQSDFRLNTGKSINVNLWLFQQKLNVIKHVIGLKYGFGAEINNFRYKAPLTFKDASPYYIIKDSVAFSKNKLTVNYLTVPLMLTINPSGKGGLSLSAGISAGYRYRAHTKQKSDARGKDKDNGDFGLNPWKLAVVGDIGYNRYRIYGSYSLTPLHDQGLNFTPYTIGVRFSKW